MKKFQVFISCVILLFSIICVEMISSAAEIVYLEGKVQVQSSTDLLWRNAEKGMIVNIGDSIRTARRSKASVVLDAEKKNTISIEEKTLVVLNSANEGIIDRLDLSKGKVYSNLEGIKSGLSFEVNTPSAIAGVRGSSYSVYVEKDTDEVVAYKDTVFIKAYDVDKNEIADMMLPEGFKTYIDRFEQPGFFQQVSNREFNRFDNIMNDLSSDVAGTAREQRKTEKKDEERLKEEQNDPMLDPEELLYENTAIDEATEDRNTIENIEERYEHDDSYEDPYEDDEGPTGPQP